MARKRRPPGEAAGGSWLERALPGVRPLAGRDKKLPPPRGAPPPARPPDPQPPATFELLREGEEIQGLAPGIDRAHLRRLRRGRVPADVEVDLHGLTLEEARGALHAGLGRAMDEGLRCVLIVHGRGAHSPRGPVLKQQLVGWLAEPPHGSRVMAFASAPEHRGGAGATYVLLRRRRR